MRVVVAKFTFRVASKDTLFKRNYKLTNQKVADQIEVLIHAWTIHKLADSARFKQWSYLILRS